VQYCDDTAAMAQFHSLLQQAISCKPISLSQARDQHAPGIHDSTNVVNGPWDRQSPAAPSKDALAMFHADRPTDSCRRLLALPTCKRAVNSLNPTYCRNECKKQVTTQIDVLMNSCAECGIIAPSRFRQSSFVSHSQN
jgi:hypothetical protein